MLRQRRTSQVSAALKELFRKEGVSPEHLQAITGWARKPTSYDLREMAARHGLKLVAVSGMPDGLRRYRVTR